MKKTFSAVELLKDAWQLFLLHKRFYIKTVLVFGLISIVADLLSEDKSTRLVDIVLSLISMVSYWYGTIVIMKGSLAVTSGTGITDDVSRISWSIIFSLIISSVLVCIGTFVGFILFIIPGIIFSIRATLTQYIILHDNQKAVPAIKKSLALTKGYFWSFFRLILCFVFLAVISVVPFMGLGFIVLIPVSTIALTLVYKKLRTETEVVNAPVQTAI